jgi:tetratricopeptide (TPR) repeat protein
LALAQAAAVIAAQHLDYPTYLARLRSVPVRATLKRTTGEPYAQGVAETILLALTAVADEDRTGLCSVLMNVIALLSTAGVPRTLLYSAGEEGLLSLLGSGTATEPESIDEAFGQLASASLLTFSMDDSTVAAHRLTMRVARERQTQDGSLAGLGAGIAQLLLAVTQSLNEPWRNRSAARDTIQQIMALHENLKSHLGEREATLTEALLRLRAWALSCLIKLGDSPAQAIEHGQNLVTDAERILGASHPATLKSRNDLGEAYRESQRLEEAIQLFERNLTDCEQTLGEFHPDTLETRDNLALTYRDARRLEEAIQLFERTLTDCEHALGESHPATLTERNNLASAYQDAGRLDEAIQLFERNLADSKRILGDSNPGTLCSQNNLALAYRHARRLNEAIPLFERTLTDCERILGSSHLNTLKTRNNLAESYWDARRLDEAIPLFERTLAERERILGVAHPDTLRTRNNLIRVYRDAGQPVQSERLRNDRP